ncbi:hypothetical protein QM012_004168 [Aureobasidium pullulans]|uniref:Uncharacterized protein n=1 Tax=Aureobasidium pullulans TaxID=5580 RepID=A0ABR0TSD9_AURPU
MTSSELLNQPLPYTASSTHVAQAMTQVYVVVVQGFIFEQTKQFDSAISAFDTAIKLLEHLMPRIKKDMQKIHRKMFERQLDILRERKSSLDKSALSSPPFSGLITPPTVLSADAELESAADGKYQLLSLDEQTLYDYSEARPKDMDTEDYYDKAPDHIQRLRPNNVPKFAPTLNSATPPTVYHISHDSELVYAGERSHWYFVKDATNTTTLYALQAVWHNDAPMTEAVLRRPGEFLPAAGALQVSILRTPNGAIMLKMTGHRTGLTLEMPDQYKKSGWSSRRFYYGGRRFVWREPDKAGLFSKFQWNELFETSRVWSKPGSRTGKNEDEVVGSRLCWGENHGGMHENHTIYMAGGLDQYFREHLLASQLTRLLCKKNPPVKESKGLATATAGATLLSVGASLFS